MCRGGAGALGSYSIVLHVDFGRAWPMVAPQPLGDSVYAFALPPPDRPLTRSGASHPALRESAGNAVMTLRGFRTEHGLEGGELEALLGDRRALDHLFSVTYEELRRLASSVRRSDANASLSPTTLVNEAWLKLRTRRGLLGSRACTLHGLPRAPCAKS